MPGLLAACAKASLAVHHKYIKKNCMRLQIYCNDEKRNKNNFDLYAVCDDMVDALRFVFLPIEKISDDI